MTSPQLFGPPSSRLNMLADPLRSSSPIAPTMDDGIAVDGYRNAELVICRAVTGGQLLDLSPVIKTALIAPEDVGRAFRVIIANGPNDRKIAADGHGDT